MISRVMTAAVAVSLAAAAWLGGAAGANAAPETAAPTRPLTAPDAEAWLDGYLPYALKRGGVPGAVVVIVKDGQVLLEKGYGLADVAAGKRVDPAATLFRIGSVSKLFTWTAVMQQVEAGKLDLDADVNRYLEFKIPPRGGKPVTLRNLMTHTAGFEEAVSGLATRDARTMPPLGESLARWVPRRVFDAGTTPAYSNYGAALAGHIVERVSGEPFNAYVARHILAPLGMRRTTFDQPLPPALQAGLAKGYPTVGKPPQPFEQVGWPPAGSASATGDDMARFMIAHLQQGRFGDAQILKPETAQRMHAPALTRVPPLNGMALGFYEQRLNGHRAIAHGGDTVLFHSDLVLFPEDRVGLFISMNAAGTQGASGVIRSQLSQGFADRYLPDAGAPDGRVEPEVAAAHARMFAPAYGASRASFSSFMSALGLLGGEARVTTNGDGTISVSGLDSLSGEPARYREIEPFVWREVGGKGRIAGLVERGRIVRIASDDAAPILVMDAVPFGRRASVLGPAAVVAAAALAVTLALWPVAVLVRRRYGAPFSLTGARAWAHRLVRFAAIAALAAIGGWLWVLSLVLEPMGVFFLAEHALGIHLVQAVTLAGFVGGLIVSLYSLAVVWRGPSGWFGKLWSLVLALAFAVLVWLGAAYHLLGFGLNY